MTASLHEWSIDAFLDELAAPTGAAAGAAAAVTVGSAAALTAMSARLTDGPLERMAEQADQLRADVLPLADEDGAAYRSVLEALRLPRDAAHRQERIASALLAATRVPLRIAEIAAAVTEMAVRLADEGNPNVTGDAETAALLAAAAVQAAHRMVDINVRLGSLDHDLLQTADQHRDRAQAALATVTGDTR